MSAWHYIEPVDKTSAAVIGDLTYKWCSECRYRATGKQGFVTTTHGTSEHVQNNIDFDPLVNHSVIASKHSEGADVPAPEDDEADEANQLISKGPWYCAIIDVTTDEVAASPAAWIAASNGDLPHPVDEEYAIDSAVILILVIPSR